MKLENTHLNFSQNLKVQGQQTTKEGGLKAMNLKENQTLVNFSSSRGHIPF